MHPATAGDCYLGPLSKRLSAPMLGRQNSGTCPVCQWEACKDQRASDFHIIQSHGKHVVVLDTGNAKSLEKVGVGTDLGRRQTGVGKEH